ncbi:MAG: periplasmic heavy metal sensor [Thermoanaerobaculia bacterium]
MTGDLDQRQRLKAFFAEHHAGETLPPFEKLLARRARPGTAPWKWATATAAGLALLVGPGGHKRDRFEESVFAPDLVMSHQGEIGLRSDQKQALIEELQRTQADLVPLQFEMSEAGERLERLLGVPRVDEDEALAAAERVMQLESEIKRRHLTLMIRIKNLLTEEQQAELRRLRSRS